MAKKKKTETIGKKTEDLAVTLTDTEVRERGEQLAGVQGEIEKHVAREQEVKATLKADRARLDAELQKLALAVRNRSELRPVQVEIVANFKKGVANEIRLDTGEVVRSRALTASEIQGEMFDGNGADGNGADEDESSATEA